MARRSILFVLFTTVVLVTGLAGSANAQGTPTSAVEIPTNLAPPATSVLLFELDARGDQIYACEANPDDATEFVWTFKAPEADLFNSRGDLVGTHFAGPTWQGLDGSAVVAEVVERADSPDAGSIPWLLLATTEQAGSGIFSTTAHVQRLDTVGGTAPTEGCDESHDGEEARVPYEATYAFFYPLAGGTPAA